ncbi:MAG: hypothetical protein RL403_1527 [Bacteroidota bacterium]
MKIFTICLTFLSLLAVLSCETPEQQDPSISENEELLTLFTVKETTQALGVFDKFQAQELTVEKTPDSNLYRLKGESIIRLKSKDYPIASLIFKVEGGKFFLQGNERDFIFQSEGKTKITASGRTTDLLDYDPIANASEVDLLLLGFLELTTPNEKRNRPKPLLENHRIQCSFWGTYYLTAVNTSRATTTEELSSAVESGEYNVGCTKIGGVDVSCFFESHFCVATQAYCCD